jgi:hypothetical protein
VDVFGYPRGAEAGDQPHRPDLAGYGDLLPRLAPG